MKNINFVCIFHHSEVSFKSLNYYDCFLFIISVLLFLSLYHLKSHNIDNHHPYRALQHIVQVFNEGKTGDDLKEDNSLFSSHKKSIHLAFNFVPVWMNPFHFFIHILLEFLDIKQFHSSVLFKKSKTQF